MIRFIAAVSFIALTAAPALAHSGGTNAAGCHNDNSPGGYYHCH